jgi:hypothetical protein
MVGLEALSQFAEKHLSLLISFFSLAVAAFALGWHIYRDVILKPRLKVRVSVSYLLTRGLPERETHVAVSGTNFGPGPVHCNTVVLRNAPVWRRLLRRVEYAVAFHDYQHPMSGCLPSKLEVGEGLNLLFPYKPDCFLGQRYTHVGISDSFGRAHWARRKDFKSARAAFRRDHRKPAEATQAA